MSKSTRLLFALALLPGLLSIPLYHAAAQESKAASAQPSDEVVWQQFLAWLPGAPPGDTPGPMVDQYHSRLIASGTSVAEADRERDIIRRMMHERPDASRIIYNRVYTSTTPKFVTRPSAFLVTTVEGRKPGRALDVGIGQGRNSVFLASKGWDVTGFDVADEGLALALRNAEQAGVKIKAVRETHEAFDYGSDQWDLIAIIYEQLPAGLTEYAERLRRSLKQGGLIVIESFAADASAVDSPTTAVDPVRLLAAFEEFRLLHFEDTISWGDWGRGLQEKVRLVRMAVEKRP